MGLLVSHFLLAPFNAGYQCCANYDRSLRAGHGVVTYKGEVVWHTEATSSNQNEQANWNYPTRSEAQCPSDDQVCKCCHGYRRLADKCQPEVCSVETPTNVYQIKRRVTVWSSKASQEVTLQ
ncbi:hypothetical protein OIU85_001321 [Salix viminalis]|uniref:Secreted protein n=1 Tax=Salix viminalis TaxID=40686 RepID=A0A9Q0VLP4_SALVM|nr:hypothetical protein OIU85_001321 [Salix viminalis]